MLGASSEWCCILESWTVPGSNRPRMKPAVGEIYFCRCIEPGSCARSFARPMPVLCPELPRLSEPQIQEDSTTTSLPREFVTMILKTPAPDTVNHDPLEPVPVDATAGPCPPALDTVLGGPTALGVLQGWKRVPHVRRPVGVDHAREFGNKLEPR